LPRVDVSVELDLPREVAALRPFASVRFHFFSVTLSSILGLFPPFFSISLVPAPRISLSAVHLEVVCFFFLFPPLNSCLLLTLLGPPCSFSNLPCQPALFFFISPSSESPCLTLSPSGSFFLLPEIFSSSVFLTPLCFPLSSYRL